MSDKLDWEFAEKAGSPKAKHDHDPKSDPRIIAIVRFLARRAAEMDLEAEWAAKKRDSKN